ncbi:MAG: restriction endonuclease [Candidatus Micrarchaeota archaeon]|nr:restriction endonuclease [Candidatus Micrarchaeota archaeon]
MEHEFTKNIKEILRKNFGEFSDRVFSESQIIQYLNIKTKSASKGSKSRGSFANLYAVYVLVEDYVSKGYHEKSGYTNYEGAVFTDLFRRQRELPFGQKLQNHALNHRMNEEFKKYFPTCDYIPILRDLKTNRYWFNENLLKIKINKCEYNLAETIIQIINAYIETKKGAFERFIQFCESSQKMKDEEVIDFITSLIEPTVDARIFEIVSYSILKYYYHDQKIYWGFEIDKIKEENLKLFKTGRTNANDGGIDFVMKPLGRFFQVTETVDVNKYFLDIDKIEKYPITFVVKSSDTIDALKSKIQKQAEDQYSIKVIVKRYMECIEEIINVPSLLEKFKEAENQGHLCNILTEIIKQSKVEFNYEDDYNISSYEEIEIEE